MCSLYLKDNELINFNSEIMTFNAVTTTVTEVRGQDFKRFLASFRVTTLIYVKFFRSLQLKTDCQSNFQKQEFW